MGAPVEPSNSLCKAIRDVRKEQGMTQVDVAERLGLQQAYVSAWERHRVPNINQLITIEDTLGVAHGTILRRAGYIEQSDSMPLEHAIKLDRRLSAESKKLLSEFLLYRLRADGTEDVPAVDPTPRRRRRRAQV